MITSVRSGLELGVFGPEYPPSEIRAALLILDGPFCSADASFFQGCRHLEVPRTRAFARIVSARLHSGSAFGVDLSKRLAIEQDALTA